VLQCQRLRCGTMLVGAVHPSAALKRMAGVFMGSEWAIGMMDVPLVQERGAALQAMSALRTGPMHVGGNPAQKRKAGEALGNSEAAGNGRSAISMGFHLSEERRKEIMEAELSD
jgi:hypothetical protein